MHMHAWQRTKEDGPKWRRADLAAFLGLRSLIGIVIEKKGGKPLGSPQKTTTLNLEGEHWSELGPIFSIEYSARNLPTSHNVAHSDGSRFASP